MPIDMMFTRHAMLPRARHLFSRAADGRTTPLLISAVDRV